MRACKAHARSLPSGRIAYVNGRYLAHRHATVHVEDRGLQLADSVYEVFAVLRARLTDEEGHFARLARSLAALDMPMPMEASALKFVLTETLRRNRVNDGLLYLQVTRGSYKRDHVIPPPMQSTLIVTARAIDMAAVEKRRSTGIAVITLPDIRWGRCDIKATGLLPNVMAKTEARKLGAFEAWLFDREGFVTEGASTNAWIVTPDGVIVTRDLSANVLAGVTRAGVLAALAKEGINSVEERHFTVAEAYTAREAFITSATGGVIPVISIDGRALGKGTPGEITRRVHALYGGFRG